jgi:ATP-dependent protease HslVU (ClpYQ) peptidase subunit
VPEGVQEVLAVCVVLENGLFLVSSRGDVIDCAWIFYAEGTGHEFRLAQKKVNVKSQDLTLKVLC